MSAKNNFTHLRQIGTNRLFVRNPILAKRKDMVPCDPKNPDVAAPGFEGAGKPPVERLADILKVYTEQEVLQALEMVFKRREAGGGLEDAGGADPGPAPAAEAVGVDPDDPLFKLTRKQIGEQARQVLDPNLVLDVSGSKESVVQAYRTAEARLEQMRAGA